MGSSLQSIDSLSAVYSKSLPNCVGGASTHFAIHDDHDADDDNNDDHDADDEYFGLPAYSHH